ncbi:hypothetical protein [Paenibacillus polymyxa]|uniref:hypothetical protein n=1 Tax=Paenibacillus polymyxa TaxID=1406 RepID=UPI002ED04112|nr:hypothetical protein [Paenibacillus polymyxa]
MSYHAEVLNVLIASPSDVEIERDEVEKAIYEWNRRFSEQLNVVLLPRRWENDVAPAYRGTDPQQIINEKIVDKSDILIGIFWTKLGTPTLNHSSGTLEEINQFIQAQKDVMLYFLDKPVPRSNTNYPEMQRVDEFKRDYSSKGIFSVYSTEKVLDHLYKNVTTRQTKGINFTQEVIPAKVNSENGVEDIIDIEKLIIDEVLSDNEILLLTFSIHTGTRQFGERWMAEQTIENIENWLTANDLLFSNLTSSYSGTIINLTKRGILTATDYTRYGNPKNYTLKLEIHDRLRKVSHEAAEVIRKVLQQYKSELPF